MNPDRFIANRNIERYLSGKPLDTWYLSTLSHDVVPRLIELFEGGNIRETDVHGELGRQLWERLEYRLLEPEVTDWRSWHFSRLKARNELLERKDMLQTFKDYVPKEIYSLIPLGT